MMRFRYAAYAALLFLFFVGFLYFYTPANQYFRLKQKSFFWQNLSMHEIYRRAGAEIDPSSVFSPKHFSERKKVLEKALHGKQDFLSQIELADLLLAFGHTREAIEKLEKVRTSLRPDAESDVRILEELLAIAYFRMGEQENCQHNHTAKSCIYPLVREGIHLLTNGASKANQLYSTLSDKYPARLDFLWLMNLSFSAIGKQTRLLPESKRVIPKPVANVDFGMEPFADVAELTGYRSVGWASGGILDDFDNDGHLDIVSSGKNAAIEGGGFENNLLQYFSNNKDGTYSDRSTESAISSVPSGVQMVQADYDNDGLLDLIVVRGGWSSIFDKKGIGIQFPASLVKNFGKGKFRETTIESGILKFGPSHTASWGDIDNDGWLDLFVGFESNDQVKYPSALFKNNRDGTFTDASKECGVSIEKFVKGSSFGDFNNDGRIDLFLSVYDGNNQLLQNMGPGCRASAKCCFSNVAEAAGVTEPQRSFSTWFWDYNNDGWEDLMVFSAPDVSGKLEGLLHEAVKPHFGKTSDLYHPFVYLNQKNGTFANVAKDLGLSTPILAMGSNFGDFNNDGWLDFYVGTGAFTFSFLIPNLAFLSQNGSRFLDITEPLGVGHLQKGHAVSFGDYDNNGSQDILANMGGALPADFFSRALFRNPNRKNKWLQLNLRGKKSNRFGVGARLKLLVRDVSGETREIFRTITSGSSYGASTLRAEIGLGNASSILKASILWPTGDNSWQEVHGLKMNNSYFVHEGENSAVLTSATLKK